VNRYKIVQNIINQIKINYIKFSFLAFFIIGLVIYDDYGVSFDEGSHRGYGKITFDYLFFNDQAIFTDIHRFYGPSLEFFITILDYFYFIDYWDFEDAFILRHFIYFLLFFASSVSIYLTSKIIFNNKFLAYISFLFYILSPRIFADSFYNPKDTPFMFLFIFSFYFMLRWFLEPKKLYFLFFFGLFTGLSINARILGSILIFLFLVNIILKKKFSLLKYSPIYIFTSFIVLYITWPYLYQDPINRFIESYNVMKSYPMRIDSMFNGNTISSQKMPWEYVPVWILVTVPVQYLFFAFLSIKNLLNFKKVGPEYYLLWLWVLIPVISVIVLNSTLYNGWRQLYFIYPAMVLLFTYGFRDFINIFKFDAKVISVVVFVPTLVFMIINHPFQYAYFNFLSGSRAFEVDYWGLSYKQAYEFILRDSNKKENILVKIHTLNGPPILNLKFIDSYRINLSHQHEHYDYYIFDFFYPIKEMPKEKPYHRISVGGRDLILIFKKNNSSIK